MEMLAHAENIGEIPVHRCCPCGYQVAVAAHVHLRRGGGDDIHVYYQDKRVAGVNGALDAAEEHDGGVIRESVYRQRCLHDNKRQGIFGIVVVSCVFAEVADRAAAYADNAVNALKVSLNLCGVFRSGVDDTVRL